MCRKVFLLCFFIGASILCLPVMPSVVLAQDSMSAQLLESNIRRNTYFDEYILSIVKDFRKISADGTKLTSADIDRLREDEEKKAVSRQVSLIIVYDLNHDTNITMDEISKSMEETKRRNTGEYPVAVLSDSAIRKGSDLDTNKDGTVSYKEMWALPKRLAEQIEKTHLKPYRDLLARDPDKDGVLTLEELKKVAEESFRKFDSDSDNQITAEEYNAYNRARVEALKVERDAKARIDSGDILTEKCGFENVSMPAGLKVFVAGDRGGYTRNRKERVEKHNEPPGRFDVIVNQPGHDVALILGSYDSSLWSIRWTEGTRIHSVVVGGYKKQVVEGVSAETPVLISTHEQGDDRPCGYFYFKRDKLDRANPLARHIYGNPADMFFPPDENGVVVIGAHNFDSTKLKGGAVDSLDDKSPIDVPQIAGMPKDPADAQNMKGLDALREAVAQGYLRSMSDEDAQQWVDIMVKKSGSVLDLPPSADGSDSFAAAMPKVNRKNSYVILKEFTLPAGLEGAESASFVVPKGVPIPKGDRGHSTIYDMNEPACNGPRCKEN